MRKIIVPITIFGLIALDQISKWWIVAHIDLGEIKPFIPRLFSLTYLRNYGAAFSMLQNQQWLFTVITLITMGGASYYLMKHIKGSKLLVTALVLIISGGLGNFIDRVRFGYVVDMVHLDFMEFAIFNVADSYLTIGVGVMCLALWREESEDNSKLWKNL